MSFVGQLSDFRLVDLLQMIATSGKTGKLSLTRRDAKGLVVFRNGKIIYATTSSMPRETLGTALLLEQLISVEQLKRAIETQRATGDKRRLGEVLVGLGLLQQEDLERVVHEQIESVISEFMEWDDAFFKFELHDLPERGEIEVDARDFLLDTGLSADHVLLGIAVKLDELEREATGGGDEPGEARPVAAIDEPQPVEPIEDPQPLEAIDDPRAAEESGAAEMEDRGQLQATLRDHALHDLTPLRSIMREIRSPEFTGEITVRLLDYARKLFKRGVLFLARGKRFDGMGGFGDLGSDGLAGVRAFSLSAAQPSVVREVAERNETYCGPMPFLPANQKLLSELGGGAPSEVAVLPLSVNGRVMAVFYGDNLPDDTPIGSLAELEVLLLQMGLAMEKELLAKRVKELEVMQQLLRQA